MESFGDKARAWLFALLVHLACLAVMFIGLLWTQTVKPPVALAGPIIEAELVGAAAAPPPRRAPPKPKPTPPKPEPPKPPEPKPDESPPEPQRQDLVDRERIVEMAQQKAEQEKRAQEEKRRQEQANLRKELEDVRKQRELAEKKRKLEQEKLAQLNDIQKQQVKKPAPAETPPAEKPVTGMAGQDTSKEAEYYAAIQRAVTENWLRPESAQAGLRCAIRIVQIPGGDVISAELASPCNADPMTRTSIEQAVRRASPLPYRGYEKEFARQIRFNFTYDG